jgi:hypothetical protein
VAENAVTDFSDLLQYRESVKNQPETSFQKITLDIIDKAIENLKKKV